MIGDVYGKAAANARSVYVALTEIASDKASDIYDASHSEIAHRAGTSVSTVQRILPTFVKLGKIKIRRNAFNGIQVRSTYTIIRRTPVHSERTPIQLVNANCPTEEVRTKKGTNGEEARMEKKEGAEVRSLAEESADLIARSTPSPNEPHIVITPAGERFNTNTGEREW